jgi:hypothetical protein
MRVLPVPPLRPDVGEEPGVPDADEELASLVGAPDADDSKQEHVVLTAEVFIGFALLTL